MRAGGRNKMAGTVIFITTAWGCAALFFGMGIFAERREKPMWFWSGDSGKDINVTDVKAHNRAHGIMWKRYSIWFWLSGAVYFFSAMAAVVIMILSCTVGIFGLFRDYNKIEKKYIIK